MLLRSSLCLPSVTGSALSSGSMGVFFSKLFSGLFGKKEVRFCALACGVFASGNLTLPLCLSVCLAFRFASLSLVWTMPARPPSCVSVGETAAVCRLRTCLTFLVLVVCSNNTVRLQVDEPVTTVPTIGFNVETLQYKNIKFQVWDLGGQSSIRPYWRCYYPNTHAIVFVVDRCVLLLCVVFVGVVPLLNHAFCPPYSADTDRLETARAELMAMLEEEDLKDAILLVFANKQDMPGALSAAAVRLRRLRVTGAPLFISQSRCACVHRFRRRWGWRQSKTGSGASRKRRPQRGRGCSRASIGW